MQSETKHTIWLDCDPGLDDTIAIILSCRDPRLNLIGISTSAGNTSIENTTRNALDILYNCHRSDVPVVMGAKNILKGLQKLAQHMHGSNGLGGVQVPKSDKQAIIADDPFEVIFNMINKVQGKIIWANTGSMTNLYYLLTKYPEVKSKMKEIVIMGGAVGQGNITPAAEFNIFFDPHAAEGVFKNKGDVPLTMIPLQLTHGVVANQQVFNSLEKQNKPFAKAILQMLTQYKKMYWEAYGEQYYPWPPVHDPAVIYYILQPQQFQLKKAKIIIDTCEVSYGRTNCYFKHGKNPVEPVDPIDQVGMKMKSLIKFWELNFKHYREIFDQQVGEKSTVKK